MGFRVSIPLFFLIFVASTASIKAATITTSWESYYNLPYPIASNTAATDAKTIYTLGGSSSQGGSVSEILASTPSVSTISWGSFGNTPLRLIWHSVALNSSGIFILGGFLDNIDGVIKNVSDVYFGLKDTGMQQFTWNSVTPLPQPLALGAAITYNNKIYFAGGNPTPSYEITQNTNQYIYSSTINPDGSIGTWDKSGLLPDRLIGFGLLEINGYLYVFGGKGTGGYSSSVFRAKISDDGSIPPTWENLPSLPIPLWRFGITKLSNFVIIAGGQSSGDTIVSKTLYSTIDENGKVSDWQYGPDLPYPNCCSPLVSLGSSIYLIGGHDGGSYTNRVLKLEVLTSTATLSPSPSPTPSLFPSPSPTITSSPTNTPSPKSSPILPTKVYLLPGMGASWNLESIIKCNYNDGGKKWTLAPYAKVFYKDLINAISKSGWNTREFYYDWRIDVRKNAAKLKDIIDTETLPDEKVILLGHSMGGLVARSYTESDKGMHVYKYISVGTPHEGSALAYPAYSKGIIWTNDIMEKIASTILFEHCGVPESMHNLIPTYPYLIDDKSNIPIDSSNQTIKNNYLPTDFAAPFWGVKVHTISGIGQKTLKNIVVKSDPEWPDGIPLNIINTDEGDNTVLASSAKISNAESNLDIPQSHSGLVASTEGINKVLQILGSPEIPDPPYKDPNSALVVVGYPDKFWIKDMYGKVYQSEEGIISLFNPQSGYYTLQTTPGKNSTFIALQLHPNKNISYKEYAFRNIDATPKIIRYSKNSKEDDIILKMPVPKTISIREMLKKIFGWKRE